jgi:hypothetical protein
MLFSSEISYRVLFLLLPDEDDESILHITAFRIPVRHTLYLPGGTVHSNDYLKGTWYKNVYTEAKRQYC